MYATKRRRRNVRPHSKPPTKDPPQKSNPSKRHRERLNSELEMLASLLPFEQTIITKLDKLSILRLAVSYLRTKSFFHSALSDPYPLPPDNHLHRRLHHRIVHGRHMYTEVNCTDSESVLQALSGFLFVVTCEGEVFFASHTVEQYLGFHQSDIIHQSALELIHSEDRDHFKFQLSWRQTMNGENHDVPLEQAVLPENIQLLQRCFRVRFRCLLDNASGFITLEITGKIRPLLGQNNKNTSLDGQLALFALCCPFGPLPLSDMPPRDYTFKSKHKMDMSPITMDPRGRLVFEFSDEELSQMGGYDLVHPDDLNYHAAAHLELIKTGSSGLIAYRLMTKEIKWVWLQTSSKVIYKNSKPDFILCIHRHLTEDEGMDLVKKRGCEFKLPYPIIDADPNDLTLSFNSSNNNNTSSPHSNNNSISNNILLSKCSNNNITNNNNHASSTNGVINSVSKASPKYKKSKNNNNNNSLLTISTTFNNNKKQKKLQQQQSKAELIYGPGCSLAGMFGLGTCNLYSSNSSNSSCNGMNGSSSINCYNYYDNFYKAQTYSLKSELTHQQHHQQQQQHQQQQLLQQQHHQDPQQQLQQYCSSRFDPTLFYREYQSFYSSLHVSEVALRTRYEKYYDLQQQQQQQQQNDQHFSSTTNPLNNGSSYYTELLAQQQRQHHFYYQQQQQHNSTDYNYIGVYQSKSSPASSTTTATTTLPNVGNSGNNYCNNNTSNNKHMYGSNSYNNTTTNDSSTAVSKFVNIFANSHPAYNNYYNSKSTTNHNNDNNDRAGDDEEDEDNNNNKTAKSYFEFNNTFENALPSCVFANSHFQHHNNNNNNINNNNIHYYYQNNFNKLLSVPNTFYSNSSSNNNNSTMITTTTTTTSTTKYDQKTLNSEGTDEKSSPLSTSSSVDEYTGSDEWVRPYHVSVVKQNYKNNEQEENNNKLNNNINNNNSINNINNNNHNNINNNSSINNNNINNNNHNNINNNSSSNNNINKIHGVATSVIQLSCKKKVINNSNNKPSNNNNVDNIDNKTSTTSFNSWLRSDVANERRTGDESDEKENNNNNNNNNNNSNNNNNNNNNINNSTSVNGYFSSEPW